MASEDVIELGSSDDETEPAPKKSKTMPNAMVCIPRKLHEVTIKPAKLNVSGANKGLNRGPISKGVSSIKGVTSTKGVSASKGVTSTKGVSASKGVSTSKGVSISKGSITLPKGLTTIKGATSIKGVTTSKGLTIAKGVTSSKGLPTVKPSNVLANPFAGKSKTNGKPVHKNIARPQIKLAKPITIQNFQNTNIVFTKIGNPPNFANVPSSIMKNPIKIANTKSLSNLPSGITVKRTTHLTDKPVIFMNAPNIHNAILTHKPSIEVPTVELDDDEGSPPNSSPAWYIRPEEQTVASLEQENNKEPEPPTMIEITIEDSPIKPIPNKRTCEIGAELAITIDDSPVKANTDKNTCSGSEDETGTGTVPHSKKKLEYPKEAESENRKTVEIEIDMPYEINVEGTTSYERVDDSQDVTIVAEKKAPEPSTQEKTKLVPLTENKAEIPRSSTKCEFHPVYQSFIDLCFQLENSDDMAKIVEKKIKAYYRQVPKEYTESEEFVDMVASKILAMKASPDKMYLYIKDIVDELNMQRKIAKSQITDNETKTEEPEHFMFGNESEYDTKRQRQIRKLEKTIKKLHRAIQKLEEQEVDFDDDDDSVYLLTERYKERLVRVYAKFCQLTNTKMPSEPRIVLDARPGQPSGPAKRLEKWINKKVPIGTPLPFPDFHDVLRCVREANVEDKLLWNEADIMEEARDLFTRCGKKLQRRRQENEWRLAASRLPLDVDPAENNEQLKCKLEENRKVAANKETEIFNKYVDRQNQLKLEAVEIGDKEAEESPCESEEEEANDENISLENKKKRKERLKRLLHERSLRAEGKENQQSKESKVSDDDATITKTNEEETEITRTEADSKEVKDDSSKTSEKSQNNDKSCNDAAETLSVSDDSNDLESDIDELHLLQKLHSGNEAQSSTQESSNSDSPIAISDSLDSSSESKNHLSDVISIENSSYSESEVDKNIDNVQLENTDGVEVIVSDKITNIDTETMVHAGMEADISNMVSNVECSNTGAETIRRKSNNDEYTDAVENILLASSDDESQEGTPPSENVACINLKDDLISIDETVVGNVVHELEKYVETETNDPADVESTLNKPIMAAINANDVDKDNKVIENGFESKDTLQIEALSSSSQKEFTIDNDKVVPMDVDQDETVKEVETQPKENVALPLSSETSEQAVVQFEAKND